GEPPRRMRSCGVSPVPLFPQESSLCPPINCYRNETDEIYVQHSKKNEPLIKHVDQWFVFNFV
ncbi:hypothetical protein, partial [Priestia megaterium]|uniref:hypothetical protein n=1 Tax=Priestia megaterium TaxID=1404 RepID=UPI002FFDA270